MHDRTLELKNRKHTRNQPTRPTNIRITHDKAVFRISFAKAHTHHPFYQPTFESSIVYCDASTRIRPDDSDNNIQRRKTKQNTHFQLGFPTKKGQYTVCVCIFLFVYF